MFQMWKVILIFFMLVCALSDLRNKAVDIRIFAAMLAAEIVMCIWRLAKGGEIRWISILTGGIQGILLGILSRVSKGALGAGDAVYFTLTGFILGGKANGIFIAGTVFAAALIGLVILMIGTWKKKRGVRQDFPLLPIALPIGVLITVIL